MYYKARQGRLEQERGAELSPEQLARAMGGFTAALWAHRCHPDFIATHREEIFALAQTEYARALAKGASVPEPVGWLINCAWRRAQNALTAANRTPPSVSEEVLVEDFELAAPSAEQLALENARAERVRAAVSALSEEERRLLALTYFSDNSLRGAARLLGLDVSKVKRTHKAALEKIYDLLGVTDSDELQLEIAVVAWLSLGVGDSGSHLPGGVEAVLERAGHAAANAFSRAGELARRLQVGGGSDAAGVLAGSGAGRGVGACATVLATACLAGAGLLAGPGVGGLGIFGHHSSAPHGESAQTSSPAVESSPAAGEASEGAAEAPAGPVGTSKPDQRADSSPSHSSAADSDAGQVKQQTDAFSRAAGESGASPTPAPAPSAPPEPQPNPAAEAQAAQQFGGFH